MPSPYKQSSNTPAKPPALRSYLINADADRRLTRLSLLYSGTSFALLLGLTFLIPYANARQHLPYLLKFLINWGSLLVVLIPFFLGIDRMNTARLDIGRERVQARAWSEAVAALQPFDSLLQRLWDRSGEAHYWLGQAYAGLGDKVRAEKARAFVRRKDGPWAEKLAPSKGPGISRAAVSRSRAKVYDESSNSEGTGTKSRQEKRSAPPKSKPRRRF